MALITLAEALTFLRMSSGVADTTINALITGFSAQVNTFCFGQDGSFEVQSYYERIDIEGDAEDSIKLSHVPILTVAALTDNGSLVATSAYKVYKYGRISLESTYFTKGYQKVEASYTAGYSPVPEDAKDAVRMLVANEYKAGKRRGFLAEKIGDYSYRVPDLSKSDGFPDDVRRILMQFRRVVGP